MPIKSGAVELDSRDLALLFRDVKNDPLSKNIAKAARKEEDTVSVSKSTFGDIILKLLRASGAYNPLTNQIWLKDHDPEVLAHELIHFLARDEGFSKKLDEQVARWNSGDGNLREDHKLDRIEDGKRLTAIFEHLTNNVEETTTPTTTSEGNMASWLDSIFTGTGTPTDVPYSPMDATGEVSGGTLGFEQSPSVMSSVFDFLKDKSPEEQAEAFKSLGDMLKSFGGMTNSIKKSPFLQQMLGRVNDMRTQQGGMSPPAGGIQVPNDAGPDLAQRILKSAGLL